MSARNRNGLSKLEVVVVLVVLMLLAAVLVPAMHPSGSIVREAARRSDCKNKLKQIGISLLNYHETFGVFPPGWIAVRGPSSGEREQSAYGWLTYCLPFMDSSPFYKKIGFGDPDPSFQFQAMNGFKFASTVQPAFRCPSDWGESQITTASGMTLATSNYVGNFGVGIPERQHSHAFMQGILGENSNIRIRDILDGATNVVIAGERRQPRVGTQWELGRLDGSFNSYWAGMPKDASPLVIVGTVTDGILPDVDSEQEAVRLKKNDSDLLNFKGPLNGTNGSKPSLRVLRINKLSDGAPLTGTHSQTVSGSYSSYHPGGTHVLLVGGSVRFVSDSIDPQIYINLMRRADGEALGEF